MAELVKEFISGIYNLFLGMFTTGKHLGRHAITIQYPKERWTMPERSRGMVVLLTDHETGNLNCTACLLCMRACPVGAIEIDSYRDEKKKRHLKGFIVNYNMCCFCGLCEESCNFAAIKLAPKYEFPEFDRNNLIWDIKKLTEMGLDVPYEKPVRKKPVVKKKVAAIPVDKATDDETSPVAEPVIEKKEEAKSPQAAEETDDPGKEAADTPEVKTEEEVVDMPAAPDSPETDMKSGENETKKPDDTAALDEGKE